MKKIAQLFEQLYNKKIIILLFLDFILLPLALFCSVLLRLGGNWDHRLDNSIWLFLALPLWTIPIFINLGLYKAIIKYLDEKVVLIIFIGVSLSVLILCSILFLNNISAFPLTSIIIFWILALAYIGGTRIILRGILRNFNGKEKTKVAIYGAGNAGVQICLALQNGNEYEPIAFFDDDEKKWNSTIRGIGVYNAKILAKIVKLKNINQILLAIPSASHIRKKEIIETLELLSLKIKTLPSITDIIKGTVTISDIKEVDIEDLLSRDEIPPNIELLQKNIYNKVVLITGAGGSIGQELINQIAELKPKTLILFELCELSLYRIEQHVTSKFPEINSIGILGSVLDEILISKLLNKFKVNIIYHAAAYKHVPIVEYNPISGINNNSMGTYIIAKQALIHAVENVILISTDKAVRPTNIMGASKRLAELILQAFNDISTKTIFTIVRFGNVLGSSGSVVPLFRKQIKSGGPVTVTHKEVIRYLMTIKEAVGLVIQAGNMSSGGEVFVLDMGEPVKIMDLAKHMIRLSGFTVKEPSNLNGDIEIKITGLRPGEKLYEELLIGNNPDKTDHSRIMKAHETYFKYDDLQQYINLIKKAVDDYDINSLTNLIKEMVPDYKPLKTFNII